MVAIDRTKQTTTLRFDGGHTESFPVRDDFDLSQHEVGEVVVFRHTEMIVISMDKQ